MKFNIQRLRNLTTRKLHTEIGNVYEDLLPTPTDEERMAMFERFTSMPNPLEGKRNK